MRKHLNAFGAARYLASVHVVAGHLWRKDPKIIADWGMSDWGYTWVSDKLMPRSLACQLHASFFPAVSPVAARSI